MSSNVPTNEQNAAVDAGSDTDSISSLSSQAANMNLDRSSPPALLSSEASDEEGDITIIKEDSPSKEEGPDEEAQMPFLDKYGQPVTEGTPPEDFGCWPEYLLFCKQGPKLKIRLAVVKTGVAVGYRKVDYSKKLLVDHSEYFRGLYRAGMAMAEGEVGHLNLNDIDIVSFERLYMVVSSGHPAAHHNIGPTFRTLSDLLDCAVLCDRFMMRRIEGWVRKMMSDYMTEMAGWSVRYQQEVIAHPNAGLLAQHRERVLDVSDAYERTISMSGDSINLPLQPHRYVSFLISACPRVLLAQMVNEFPPPLVVELAREMLVPT
ncbi:hypothetical protein SLS64_001223 [Diaporthe eres]|uniref:BTB domain-containing protein n=1 Tax=Diaporthe eres TaxID=83184 RepID=A0ABR1PQX0_DIAER